MTEGVNMKASGDRVVQLIRSHEDDSRPLRRAILFEEYYVLTKDALAAIVLNQFVYWSQRVRDFDKFIYEENERRTREGLEEIPLMRGWIYKTAEELALETMLASESSVRRAVILLVQNGWVSERTNPQHRWDRTLQYRVNLVKLCKDLAQLGYVIPGYKVDLSILQGEECKIQAESSRVQVEAAIP
jgi:hypothetical protein